MSPSPQLPLRDIHIPNEISWFPPAIGWWLLLILIPLSLFVIYWLFKRITRKTAVKQAKKQLEKIKQDTQKQDNEKLAELGVLLRRVAISIYPRSECASLTGNAWLEFLDLSLDDKPFSQGIGQCLGSNRYQKNPPKVNMTELVQLIERWLKAQKNHSFSTKN